VAPEAPLVVPGETRLSGVHHGPAGVAAWRRLIGKLSGGTWRPLREDSFDVTVSEWHEVVLDRYLAERDGRTLDSHEAIVLAVENGLIVRLFHYVHDAEGFAAFWS
jgi:ketosteroid isomerase-like protein